MTSHASACRLNARQCSDFQEALFFVTAKKIKVDNNKTDIIEKHQYFSLDGFEKMAQKTLGFRFDGLQQRGILEIVRQTVDSNGGKAFIM